MQFHEPKNVNKKVNLTEKREAQRNDGQTNLPKRNVSEIEGDRVLTG
jgi:hypothetical protein